MSQESSPQMDPFKELLLLIKEHWAELWRRWLFIVILVVVSVAIGIVSSKMVPVEYVARLTFIIEETEAGGSMSSYAGVASQFGIDLGGASSAFSTDNVVELLQSRQLLTQAVLAEEGNLPLVERFVTAYELRDDWVDENPELEGITFDEESWGFYQDSLMGRMYETLIEDHIVVERLDLVSNILYVKCTSVDELFSKRFTENLVDAVADYYVEIKTQRSRESLAFVQERVDSVANVLSVAEMELAKWKDSKKSITKAEGYLAELRLQREVQILNTMYGEAIKNFELSKITLLKETPLLQIIDRPILPLKQEKLKLPIAIVIFGFIGGVLGVLWVIGAKLIRDTLEDSV